MAIKYGRRIWLEGECPRCGKILRRKYPIDYAVCDCYKFCPDDHGDGAFETRMTPYTPKPSLSSYKLEEHLAIKGTTAVSPEWSTKTIYVCTHEDHATPHYSDKDPVEVKLS